MPIDQVQVNFAMSLLLMILLGHAQYKMNLKIATHKLFVLFMGSTLILLMLEALSVLLNLPGQTNWIPYHKVINVLGFSATPLASYIGYLFVRRWLNRFNQETIVRNDFLLLPLGFNTIAALLSYQGAYLFQITTENVYTRGQWFMILPIVSYFLFIYNLCFIYKYRSRLNRSEQVVLSAFFLTPAIFTGVQLLVPSLLLTWNSVAIVTVLAYIFILNDQCYRDNLTGLENRMAYDHYAQNMPVKKHKQISLIFFDFDNLKRINDQQGHMAGDEALTAFAHLLRISFPTAQKLVRLGGDEFLVIHESQSYDKVQRALMKLGEVTAQRNREASKGYQLGFSYGLVSLEPGESMEELLKRADLLMYVHKNSKKKVEETG